MGFVLKPEYQAVTNGEYQQMLQQLNQICEQLNIKDVNSNNKSAEAPLFSEIISRDDRNSEHLN